MKGIGGLMFSYQRCICTFYCDKICIWSCVLSNFVNLKFGWVIVLKTSSCYLLILKGQFCGVQSFWGYKQHKYNIVFFEIVFFIFLPYWLLVFFFVFLGVLSTQMAKQYWFVKAILIVVTNCLEQKVGKKCAKNSRSYSNVK